MCTWLAEGSSGGVRVLSALIGLGVGLLIMLLVAWALSAEEVRPAPVAPAPIAVPLAEPAPATVEPAPAPADLAERLDEGRALASSSPSGAQIDEWIEGTRALLARHRPGVLGYFAALGSRSFPDDAARLAAHLARLETIVRG